MCLDINLKKLPPLSSPLLMTYFCGILSGLLCVLGGGGGGEDMEANVGE